MKRRYAIQELNVELADIEPNRKHIDALKAAFLKATPISVEWQGVPYDGMRVVKHDRTLNGILPYEHFKLQRKVEVEFKDNR